MLKLICVWIVGLARRFLGTRHGGLRWGRRSRWVVGSGVGSGEWDEEWAGGMSGAGSRVCGYYMRLACDEFAGKRSPTERSM